MEFLDKLEELLLNPELNISCEVKEINGNRVLLIINSLVPLEECSPNFKIESIKSMIKYLKDPVNNKDEKYSDYSLKFLEKIGRNKILDKIVELNPTDNELIHLYQYAAYKYNFYMYDFIEVMKNKESIINIIKLGYDGNNYTIQRYGRENLRQVIYTLSYLTEFVSDEEYMDTISEYIKNSNHYHETNKELIDICTLMIRDQNKSSNFIKNLIGEDVLIKKEIEKMVLKLEFHPFQIMSKYRIQNEDIEKYLENFVKFFSNNVDLMLDILNLDYYKNNMLEDDGYYLHNLIIESKSNNYNEVIEVLALYRECLIEFYDTYEDADLSDFYKYLKKNPSAFRNLILKRNLEKTCLQINIEEKKKPVKI